MDIRIAIAACIFGGIVAAMILIGRRHDEAFKKKFPPISDAEFVALCGPGIQPDVALKVRRIISVSLNAEYERIYPSSRLSADLGAE